MLTLNALEPGIVLPIHWHTKSTETLVVLRGRMEDVYYEETDESAPDSDSRCTDVCRRRVLRETERILLSADGPVQALASRWASGTR